MADERWTPATVQLVTDAWVRAFYRDEEGGLREDELDAGRCVLTALADAGLLLPPGGEMCGCGVPLASHVCTHCHDDPPRGHACPRCGLFTPWRPVDPEEAQP